MQLLKYFSTNFGLKMTKVNYKNPELKSEIQKSKIQKSKN